MKKILTVSVALLAACAQAGAVTLTVEQGVVKLNQGKGFQPVQGVSEVHVGDLVKVDAKSKAKLTSADGSAVDLKPGVSRVMDRSFKALASTDGAAHGPVADPATVLGAGPSAGPAAGIGAISPIYVLGALAVAGGVAGGVAAATSSSGGNNNNAAQTALLLQLQQQRPVSR